MMVRRIIISKNQSTLIIHVMKSVLEPSISFYVFQKLQDGAVNEKDSTFYKTFIEIEFPELDGLLCDYAQLGGFFSTFL